MSVAAKVNLAPEVYQTNQRNKRRKQIATTAAVGVVTVSAGLIILLLVILGGQKIYINTLNSQIKDNHAKLDAMTDLKAAATLQAHLKSWDTINSRKTYLSRFFKELQQVDPQGISVDSLSITDSNELDVHAVAKNYPLAEKFVRALNAANVQIGDHASATATPYFSNTDLSAVTDNGNGSVEFRLTTQMSGDVTSGN
jgi:Tfp pilus assembly protein PilN